MYKVLFFTALVSLAASIPTTTTLPVSDDEVATTIAPLAVPTTLKPGLVELLDIAGADIQRAVFHQKHTVPDGTIIGTYGYFDSKEKYHVLNYVNDMAGLRVISDYTPFDPLPGTATAAAQEAAAVHASAINKVDKPEDNDFDDEKAESSVTIETKETRETHVNKKPETDPLDTSDGDNLLRDEHSIIRTHALPPPGHGYYGGYYGHQAGGFHGLDSAAFPQRTELLPQIPLRSNATRGYNQVYNSLFYGAQGQNVAANPLRRVPLPYENPLYPLLYGDQSKLGVNSETERGDDINDTSGLDASDAGGEVPSNPGRIDGQAAVQSHVSGGVGYVNGAAGYGGHFGQFAGANHLDGGHYGVLAHPTTIHHGYGGQQVVGAQGYHQRYHYPAQQVSAFYQNGYYPPAHAPSGYYGHQQNQFHQGRNQFQSGYYTAPRGMTGVAQSHRYYYRYPSQQYAYSHSYQG